MEDRYLEILLRVDERVAGLTRKVDANHMADQAARAQVRTDLDTHVTKTAETQKTLAEDAQRLREEHRMEMHELKKRIEGLEGFRKYALAIVSAVSALVTAGVQKLVALWWS